MGAVLRSMRVVLLIRTPMARRDDDLHDRTAAGDGCPALPGCRSDLPSSGMGVGLPHRTGSVDGVSAAGRAARHVCGAATVLAAVPDRAGCGTDASADAAAGTATATRALGRLDRQGAGRRRCRGDADRRRPAAGARRAGRPAAARVPRRRGGRPGCGSGVRGGPPEDAPRRHRGRGCPGRHRYRRGVHRRRGGHHDL
ncbi:Uncharacterised protein [Mycobacteroides abscessus subsp. abscessus]|nr:Uncharacterised protein [Mycobacteroides abscessus subsp. abscessus]